MTMNEEYQELFNQVLDYARRHGVGFILTKELQPDTPSASDPAKSLVVINMCWRDQNQLPYVAAHEIGHCLDGDDSSILYFTTTANHSKYEYHANKKAFEILLPLTIDGDCQPDQINVVDWMDNMHIPSWEIGSVQESVAEYLF